MHECARTKCSVDQVDIAQALLRACRCTPIPPGIVYWGLAVGCPSCTKHKEHEGHETSKASAHTRFELVNWDFFSISIPPQSYRDAQANVKAI